MMTWHGTHLELSTEVRGRSMDRWFAEGMALSCDAGGRGLSSNEFDVPCTATTVTSLLWERW